MVHGTNKCVWLMHNWKENCGKSCVGAYCKQHNYQLEKGMKIPVPCCSFGVGVLWDYCLCLSCGGSVLKQRLIRKRKKSEESFRTFSGGAQGNPIREKYHGLYASRHVFCWAEHQTLRAIKEKVSKKNNWDGTGYIMSLKRRHTI